MDVLRRTLLLACCLLVAGEVSDLTRESLVGMYNTLGGSTWSNQDGWNVGDPCENHWHGLDCDASQTVVLEIWLNSNNLTGVLPESLHFPNLTGLDLNDNSIGGVLPDWSDMPNLQTLQMYKNRITGTLPAWDGLRNLRNLWLQENRITGPLPEWSNLTCLESMNLASNQIQGELPEWDNMENLNAMSLQFNLITGELPEWNTLKSLKTMVLSGNKISGPIREWSNMTSLTTIEITDTQVNGQLPEWNNMQNLVQIYMVRNAFGGTLPEWTGLKSLQEANIEVNHISGQLPEYASLKNLQNLYINDNEINGTLPEWRALQNLRRLGLHDNHIHGQLVDWKFSRNLDMVDLSGNRITGTLPEWNALHNLNSIALSRNRISGPLPQWSTMGNLKKLYLSDQFINGTLPQWSFLPLDDLDLSSNHLCGPLPESSPARAVNLQSNVFECDEPPEWCDTGCDCDLIEGKCCPDDEYLGPQVACLPCDISCLTCRSPDTCTSCGGKYPIFYPMNGTCVRACPNKFFAQGAPLSCVPCDLNCATCRSNATYCTSCSGKAPLLYVTGTAATCVSSCPVSWFGDQGQCKECSTNCAACAHSAALCTSCPPTMLLEQSSSTCVSTCSFFDVQQGNACVAPKPMIWIIALLIAGLGIVCCCCCMILGIKFLRARQMAVYEEIEIEDISNLKNANLSAHDFFKDPVVKTVPWGDIRMGAPIGQGASGVVRRGMLQQGKSEIHVAIKELHMGLSEFNMEEQVDFIREIRFLSSLKHKNIVGFVGAAFPPDHASLALLTELAERGSLKTLLRNQADALTFARRRSLAIDAAHGIAYLHSQKVLHRDLKLDNLLVDRDWVCKVTDFGTSTNASTFSRSMTCLGTLGYIAPEVLTKDKYSKRADIFSFGIVLFELFGGQRAFTQPPFKDMSSALLNHAIIEGKRPDVSFISSTRVRKLIKDCWQQDPKKRPELSTIIRVLSSLPDDEIRYHFRQGENGFDTGEITE